MSPFLVTRRRVWEQRPCLADSFDLAGAGRTRRGCTLDLVSRIFHKGIRDCCADNARDASRGSPKAWTYAGTARSTRRRRNNVSAALGDRNNRRDGGIKLQSAAPRAESAYAGPTQRCWRRIPEAFSAPRGLRPADPRRTRSMGTGDPASGPRGMQQAWRNCVDVMVVAGAAVLRLAAARPPTGSCAPEMSSETS